MSRKTYNIQEDTPMSVAEPAVAYGKDAACHVSTTDKWNPNVPFHCTQEEFLEHIHRIEQGNFETWEEHQKKFYAWKKNFLANRM
jgi:hypothetical protein